MERMDGGGRGVGVERAFMIISHRFRLRLINTVTSLTEAAALQCDLKSINVQNGDGEGFAARVDPSVDALRQPTKQQRIQDLGNSISMKKNTQ